MIDLNKNSSYTKEYVYVVVQFYPWFNFNFLLYQTHYHTHKQNKPSIKFNHNIYNTNLAFLSFLLVSWKIAHRSEATVGSWTSLGFSSSPVGSLCTRWTTAFSPNEEMKNVQFYLLHWFSSPQKNYAKTKKQISYTLTPRSESTLQGNVKAKKERKFLLC